MKTPLRPIISLFVLVLTLTVGLSACGLSGGSKDITVESAGHRTALNGKAERVVSLSPTATETLFAIGAGKQVVAVDEQSNFPSDAPKTELSGMTPNVEAILEKKPDLVVVMFDANNIVGSLTAAKVPVLMQPGATKLSDAYQQIEDLGKATGRTKEAATTVASMKARIADAAASVPMEKRNAKYFYEVDPSGYTATSATFIGDLFSHFGLTNIADGKGEAQGGYLQISPEALVEANPDVIFLGDARSASQSLDTVAARPGMSNVNAVKNGKVVALDDDVASRWGPRVGDLAEAIAASLR